jgi:hypothetical protein
MNSLRIRYRTLNDLCAIATPFPRAQTFGLPSYNIGQEMFGVISFVHVTIKTPGWDL